ncbi:FadR/GntR family transcriptional regulator [Aurantimonas endophytica]|uniref:DNA-binding FadR family transcriptional regulator n=1 Tax=Aurantimonas endophytica TaxID=1522175 RepID=A0A7W6MQF0_9HYPH|nr:FadR/GntR family transcriptional regulator [Aurantimonas endophytica]MBB4003874.1 DNA-binding FadR family transcriptional regulator [Aurantimonas endophytica]
MTNTAIGLDLPMITQSLTEEIRQYIATRRFSHNDRLPTERELSREFGVTRGALRKALATLESDGLIWRHVGRGTFIGSRSVLNLADVTYLGEMASPAQVMAARVAMEPELARLASIYGTRSDLDEIEACNARCRAAPEWRSYEAWDNKLHHAIAKATHNKLLLYLFETLNVVRRSTVWGQVRTTKLPARDHASFAEHDAICQAIASRDAAGASKRMREHLNSVRERVLPALSG